MENGRISITERSVKTVVRKSDLPETWFGARFSAAPYMACEHGCLYCDGRAEKYWVEGQFDRDIVIRSNFTDIFGREISKLRERATVSFGSGITDPYQPVESRYRIMRDAANILAEHGMPAAVLTKSSLIHRDLDIWSSVAQESGMNLLMSVTTVDDGVRSVFEPRASTMDSRFATLEAFKNAGCGIGILAMPFLPGITDTDESIRALAARARDIGADFVLPGGLTLRPGRQKDIYMKIIANQYPHLLPLYEELYREERQSGAPLAMYREELQQRIDAVTGEFHLSPRAPHRLYRSMFPLYDEVYMLIDHLQVLYNASRTAAERLSAAVDRYREWLTSRKKTFNRKRSMTQADLESELILAVQSSELGEIIANVRLSKFIKEVVIERKVFDYETLQFV